jgi:hypothetical protein
MVPRNFSHFCTHSGTGLLSFLSYSFRRRSAGVQDTGEEYSKEFPQARLHFVNVLLPDCGVRPSAFGDRLSLSIRKNVRLVR